MDKRAQTNCAGSAVSSVSGFGQGVCHDDQARDSGLQCTQGRPRQAGPRLWDGMLELGSNSTVLDTQTSLLPCASGTHFQAERPWGRLTERAQNQGT